MNRLRWWLFVAMIVPWLTGEALAQQEVAQQLAQGQVSAQPAPADDEQTIRANAAAYVELYNRRDAKGMADMWSPEAVYTDPDSGEPIVGRESIAEHFVHVFAGLEDAKLVVTVDVVEFVSPNVAIERGSAVVTYSEHDPEETTYSAVHVKRDGKWLIDRISEEPIAPPPPSHYEQLKPLEWLVGSWVDEDNEATIETEIEWTKNQNFLRRSFAVVTRDEVTLSGVQIIGWDAHLECVRSWTFDSDGGVAEATWELKEGVWHILNKGTLPDGGLASSINLLTPIDDNSFTWESLNREVDGEVLPNVDPVLIVRADSVADEPANVPADEQDAAAEAIPAAATVAEPVGDKQPE